MQWREAERFFLTQRDAEVDAEGRGGSEEDDGE